MWLLEKQRQPCVSSQRETETEKKEREAGRIETERGAEAEREERGGREGGRRTEGDKETEIHTSRETDRKVRKK